jgi:hypothetical protein
MKNIDSLSEILQSILDENPKENLLLNDYFRLPKENQEFLERYKGIHGRLPQIVGRLILQIPSFTINTIINLLLTIFYTKQNQKFRQSITKTNELFISHATSSNAESNTDVYYENIPNKFIENNKHVTIFYLNHIKSEYSKTLNKLISKNNSNSTLLMPKFMGLADYLSYIRFIAIAIIGRVKLSWKYKHFDSLKSRIILHSILSLMKRETYSNYHLLLKCNLIQSNSSIDNIFLTLEGHGYEEEIIKQTSKKHPSTVIWLRQHSPISLAQVGVFNILKSIKKPVYILTTGSAYSNLLNKYSRNVRSFVIGTSKSRAINKLTEKGSAALVAPEGTVKSTLDFLKFIYNLNENFNKFNFIFRIHPNLIANHKIKKQIRRNSSKDNFRLSFESLERELNRTCITLYRGSAVAIESLPFNNLPIYLNFDDNLNLNVFSILETDFPILNDISDYSSFLRFLENVDTASINSNIYTQLFESLNTISISEFISKN